MVLLVTTLVQCQTYDLEIEAYFSTFRNFCQTEQLQKFETTSKKPESLEVSLYDLNGANCKNTAIWNEPSCFKLDSLVGTAQKLLNVNCEQALKQNNFCWPRRFLDLKRPFN